jgi:hypothetical protein
MLFSPFRRATYDLSKYKSSSSGYCCTKICLESSWLMEISVRERILFLVFVFAFLFYPSLSCSDDSQPNLGETIGNTGSD